MEIQTIQSWPSAQTQSLIIRRLPFGNMVGGSRNFKDLILKKFAMIFEKSVLLYSLAGLQFYYIDQAGLKLIDSST